MFVTYTDFEQAQLEAEVARSLNAIHRPTPEDAAELARLNQASEFQQDNE